MTRTAEKIRRLGHYAQMLQSHATAYFYLVVPEMMFGMDAAPEQRNLLGLIEADPALMRRVIMLRKWGQEVIKTVFGRRMHGINSVPGGVDKNLSRAECDRLLNGEEGLPSIDEVIDYAQDGLRLFHDFHEKNRSAVDGFANVPALNMSLVDADGNVDYYHGVLRIVDENKRVVREFDYHDYLDHFSEAVEEWSYMKFPFLKDLGREKGSVRVGPLARMNVTNSLSTPLAQEALERFHAYTGGAPNNMTLHTNWARTIEVLHAAELIEELLRDPDLQKRGPDRHTRTRRVGRRGCRCRRSTSRHVASSLPRRSRRRHHLRQPHRGHDTQQSGPQPHGALCGRGLPGGSRRDHRSDDERHRGRDPRLRSLPELRDARLRADAADRDRPRSGGKRDQRTRPVGIRS